MRDLIATQNLDSFTAQLLGRCSGNWFLQIVVQQKCAGFMILLLWYCNLLNLGFSLVFHEDYMHLTRSAKYCKHYCTYSRWQKNRTNDTCILCSKPSGNSSSPALEVHIYSATNIPHPSQIKWTWFRSHEPLCPLSPWSNSLNTFAKTRLPQQSVWIADQLSSCPLSCAVILNRYLIRWPSSCLMPC